MKTNPTRISISLAGTDSFIAIAVGGWEAAVKVVSLWPILEAGYLEW